jgi:hypothetical protein
MSIFASERISGKPLFQFEFKKKICRLKALITELVKTVGEIQQTKIQNVPTSS